MPRSYRFSQPISEEVLLMTLEAIDIEDPEVHEISGGLEFAIGTASDLPPTLQIGEVEGYLVQTGEQEGPGEVWLMPTFPVSTAMEFQKAWETRLNGLTIFKAFPGFLESFVAYGTEDQAQLGARFATVQDAKNFIAKFGPKVTMALPGAPRSQAYGLALEPSAEDGSPSAPKTVSTCSSASSLPALASRTIASGPTTAAPPPPTATCPAALTVAPPVPVELPPLVAPGCLRVLTGPGRWTDLPVADGDGTMRAAYEAIQEQWPGAVFVQPGDRQTAILRADAMPTDRQVALCQQSSIPIVLPTEFKAYSAAGERAVSFALKMELLCVTLNAYESYPAAKKGEFIFRHKTAVPLSRNRLVPMESGIRFLDRVIRNRKVVFLSLMGKPREGKSTFLGLTQRHFSKSSPSELPPFRCSNDTDRPCTAGLWVSLNPLTQGVVPKDDRLKTDRPDKRDLDSVVLLLDSEGLFADEGTCAEEVVRPEYSVRLFTIACVLSSCLIFNNKVSNTVGDDFMAPLAKLALHFRGFYERNPWITEQNMKPEVIYLARDWNSAQSLKEDEQDWRNYKNRTGNKKDHPLAFIVEVFLGLDFATLPKPVVGSNLKDVCEQGLLPEFEAKVSEFLDETVLERLLPKSFEDHYIRNSSTLFQLVSTIVNQVAETGNSRWCSMDYPTIMAEFKAKAVLAQVDLAAANIADALVKTYSFFEVETGPDVPMDKLREMAQRGGLELLPRSDVPRTRVQGPPQAILGLLSSNFISFQHMRLPGNLESFDSTRHTLEQEQAHKLAEPMRECGHEDGTVFALIHEKVEQATDDIRALTRDLVFHVVNMELGQVVSRISEKLAKEAASAEEVASTVERGLGMLETVASRFQTDPRVAQAVRDSRLALQNVQQQMLERPALLIRREVESHVASALGLNFEVGCDLESQLQTLNGEELFNCSPAFETVPPQLATRVARAIVSSENPRFVQELAPDEVQCLTAAECGASAQKLRAEQERRLRFEMLRLTEPLCLGDPGEWAERTASKMLELSAAPFDEELLRKLSQLLITHLQPQCDGSAGSMTQLSDAQQHVLSSPPRPQLLGHACANALKQAMQMAVKSLQRTASEDFQVALLARSAEELQQLLLMHAGIQHCLFEPMPDRAPAADGRTWFLVMLKSQEDLETLVSFRAESGRCDLQEMGLRPLRPVWVSQWSDAAIRCYSKFLLPKKSSTLLFFDPCFEAEEARLYPLHKDSYPCQNEYVEIRPRQSLVFYPVRSLPSPTDVEAAVPGLRVVTLLLLGETLVVVADLTRALKLQLSRAKVLVLQGTKAICQLSSDMVWSHETGPGLAAAWATVEAEALRAAKSKVETEIRREALDAARPKEWVAERLAAHVEQEGIKVGAALSQQLEACSADFALVWLDMKCERRSRELLQLLRAQGLALDAVEPLKPSQISSGESEDDLVAKALDPLLVSILSAIEATDKKEALGKISQLAHFEVEQGELAELWQRRLRPAAQARLTEVVSQEQMQRVVVHLGVPPSHHWHKWMVNLCLTTSDERQLCESFYQCNARHCVPEELLRGECPEVVDAVNKVCNLLRPSAECRFSESLVTDLPDSVHRSVLGCNHGHLLLQSPECVKPLLEKPIIGLDLVRTMPCYLRTRLSPSEAYEQLDPWRHHQMFIKEMQRQGEWTEVELQMWHTDMHKLHVPHFELKHMSIVEGRRGCGQASGAWAVSPSSAVFYATSFGSKQVSIPPELLSHAKDLMPPSENYIAPAAVPDEQLDGTYLVANFRHVSSANTQEVAGKDWSPASYQVLLRRFREENYREAAEALRVLEMVHTLSLLKQEGMMLGSEFKALPKPVSNRVIPCGSSRPTPRFPQTTVLVTNVDTVTAAQHAVQKLRPREKVLMLNMANRRTPGGGYAKGSAAQEEDCFRRTTLPCALVEEYSAPSVSPPAYELQEFAPVITTGVVGFRGPEEEGFPLVPPFKFDVITVPAYNANEGRGGQPEDFKVVEGEGASRCFSEEGFWKTVVNIHGLLEAAAEHGTTHLILSALGCGAFKNPPAQVAGIFKALLQNFSGCFQTVEFAVLGDNHAVFNSILPAVLPRPKEPLARLPVDALCPKLALCKKLHHGGCQRWHPRWCEEAGTCQDHSEEHRRLFQHRAPCPDRNCKEMFGPNSAEHGRLFSHPEPCRTAGCRNAQHLHPQRCPKGARCREGDQRHADGYFYSHDLQDCQHGTFCRQWADPQHMASFQHQFLPPCPDAAYCPLRTDEGHCLTCSHICELSSECPQLEEPSHTRYFIHLMRPPCPEGGNCQAHKRPNYEAHLDMYQHPGLKTCRPLCSAGCLQRQRPEHVQQHAHGDPEHALPACAVWGHNSMRHLLQAEEKFKATHFHRNAKGMKERVRKHFGCDPAPEVLKKAMEAFASWRPVHRLSTDKFGKVATSSFLASLHCLQTPGRYLELALQLPSVFKMMHEHPERKTQVQAAVAALLDKGQVAEEQRQCQQIPLAPDPQVVQPGAIGGLNAKVTAAEHAANRTVAALLYHFNPGSVQTMKQETESFFQSMRALERAAKGEAQQEGLGIGHAHDRTFETNKMVFAIYGPHTLAIYGEDKNDEHDEGVHLVFSHLSIYHPDAFLTPMCATFYGSGHGDADRPWWPPAKQKDPFDSMHSEKLHPSSPLCFEALAYEFLGRAAHKQGKRLSEVTYSDMLEYWKTANAHFVVECHLPYVTPLTLVEKAIMSQHSFNKLEKSVQEKTRKLFAGTRLEIVPGLPVPEGDTPSFPSAEAQWKAATAQGGIRPPPGFIFTLMSAGFSTAVLPVELPKKSRVRLFFTAQAPIFSITVANRLDRSQVPIDPHTFELSEGGCKFHRRQPGRPATEQSCPSFNSRLASGKRPVTYCLEWGEIGRKQCLRLRHTGASQLLNTEEVKVTDVSSALTCVIFTAQGPPAYFTNVRLHLGDDDTHLSEHERTLTIPPPPRAITPAALTVGFQDSSASDPLLKRWGKALVGFLTGSNTKPLCPEGVTCPAAYLTTADTRSDEQWRHLAEFRHVCLHGQSCTKQDDEHRLQRVHLEKPVCSDERCRQLCDVRHRAEFHHPQLWDLLLPCKYGAACRKQEDVQHCREYHHLTLDYKLDETGLRLVQSEGSASPVASPTVRGDGRARSSRDTAPMDVDDGHRQSDFVARNRAPMNADAGSGESDFLAVRGRIQDTMDDMGDIYNPAARNRDYTGAQFDVYGNPIGGNFDLAADGAFKGFRILFGNFWHNEGLPADLKALTLPELHKKGWTVDISPDMDNFTDKLSNGQYHVAWVLSSNVVSGNATAFVAALRKFHASGRGLMIWGDNVPFFAEANLFLKEQFSFELQGDDPGGTELVPGDGKQRGTFGEHLVTTGLQKLHEGVTICYPSRVPDGWEVFGTSSSSRPVLMAKDGASNKTGAGRVVVDNGWTKLLKDFWTTAGTPRYVSNCAAWLAWRERFRGPGRGFQPPPRDV